MTALHKTRHLQARFGNGGSPEQFNYKMTINTEEGVQFQTQGQDIYPPDPSQPDVPRARNHIVTGKSATITGSGTCDAGDIPFFANLFGTNTPINVQMWVGALGYFPMTVIVTQFGLKGNHEDGNDVQFDVTLESHGDVGTFVPVASYTGSGTYQSVGRTLSSGSSDTLDVNGGGLTDTLGNAVAWGTIYRVEIFAYAGNTTSLTVGAATYPFLGPLSAGGTVTLPPGSRLVWENASGWSVVAGTNDQVKVANGSGGVAKYDITISGKA